jgi:excisionase family DNA binding protein
MSDLLTTAQAAAALGISAGQLRKLAATGKVRADRTFPKAMRFDPEELARYDAGLQPGRGRPRKSAVEVARTAENTRHIA